MQHANEGREKPPFNGYISISRTSPVVGNDFVGFNREGRQRGSPFSCQAQIGLYTAYLSFYIDYASSG